MCGRFALNAETDEMIQEFVAAGGDFRDWRPRFSIAPTNKAPIVRELLNDEQLERRLEFAKWDFPRSPYSTAKGPSINARLDKLTTTWAGPLASTRCLVPMTGYFEWVGPKTDRRPQFIHRARAVATSPLLAAAGLYKAVETDQGHELRFVIITDEGRDASGEVHDRMPVFLTPDVWDEWLSPASFTPASRASATVAEARARKESALEAITASGIAVAKTLDYYPVDKKVNNVRTADPFDASLVERVG
ncbi:MAG: SOS response-associated peptidase [Cryobacterium sp.]|nr:SOS response-associated peptidase [Cryobacterium sp.]